MIADCIDCKDSDRPQNEIEYEENSDIDDAGRIDCSLRPARRNKCSKVSLLLIRRDAGTFKRTLRRDVGLLCKLLLQQERLVILDDASGAQGIRSKISFRFRGAAQRHDLTSFIHARLAALVAPDSTANVFADLIRPVLLKAGWSDTKREKARSSVSGMTWSNLHSASVEVVDADRHSDILSWCRSAVSGILDVGTGERAIAALGQNILDVGNQDESEVADSLSQAVIVNGEVLLIHPKTTLRYSRNSRPFTEMREVIGGCPYFMLTNVVLAYNEHLLDRSACLIDGIQQTVRKQGWADLRGRSDMQAAREDLTARVQLFEHQSLHVLPNIFRYPTERSMFDEIVRQRGLGQRAQGIERFTHDLAELWSVAEQRRIGGGVSFRRRLSFSRGPFHSSELAGLTYPRTPPSRSRGRAGSGVALQPDRAAPWTTRCRRRQPPTACRRGRLGRR